MHVTSWVASVVAYFVWEVYDFDRLWWSLVKHFMLCVLSLRGVLRDDGYRDVERFTVVAGSTRWDSVPYSSRTVTGAHVSITFPYEQGKVVTSSCRIRFPVGL